MTEQKRKRLTWQQRLLLEKVFAANPYPDYEHRAALAKEIDSTPRKVQIWFQNRRTKTKSVEADKGKSPLLLLANFQGK